MKLSSLLGSVLLLVLGMYFLYRALQWLTYANAVGFAFVGAMLVLASFAITFAMFLRRTQK